MTTSSHELAYGEVLRTTSFDRLQGFLEKRQITTIIGKHLAITIQEEQFPEKLRPQGNESLFVFVGLNKGKPTDLFRITREHVVAYRRTKFTNIAGFGLQSSEAAPEWTPHLILRCPTASYNSGVGKLANVMGNLRVEARRIKRDRLAHKQVSTILD